MTDIMNRMKTKIIKEFGTPCLVIDLDVVERNIQRAQKLCDKAGGGKPAAHQNP